MASIVYFSKMFQAVPHLAQVARVLPGTFVTSRRSSAQAAARLYPYMPCARYSKYLGGLAAGNRALAGADVIVTGAPHKKVLAPYGAKRCMVFHGTFMMLSQETLLNNLHHDMLCIIGPRMKTMIGRLPVDDLPPLSETGFLPFCEFPEKSPEQRQAVLARMNLDSRNRTVVYTPSRRGLGSWEYAAETLVKTAPSHFNLVLRPHPSQGLTSRRADRASFRRVAGLVAKRGNAVLDLNELPLSMALSVADLVVSDANSPSEEALFYDVPQLFIETPQYSRDFLRELGERESMHADDLGKLLTLYDCGPCIQTQGAIDFSEVLDGAISGADQYQSMREEYFAWVFGERDRMAHMRVAKAITEKLL